MSSRHAFSPQLPFLLLSLLTGLTSSFVTPIMSYFLIDEINVQPIFISVYMVSVTLSGLMISHYLGHLADKGFNANRLYGLTMICVGITMVAFIFSNQFWQVFLAGVLFMSVGTGAVSQMLTVSGLWAKKQDIDLAAFNSKVRAAISLAWVVGPPLAFTLVASFGFAASFSVAIACVITATLFVVKIVPPQKACQNSSTNTQRGSLSLSFWLVGLAVLAGMAGNDMYLSSMPLYVMRELGLPENLPGLMMGVVAALEIPTMLIAAKLTRRFPPASIMAIAFLFGCCFYMGIYFSQSSWELLSLQILNALFYGLYAGIGLTLLQQQSPNLTGFTSVFYSNASRVGMMLGTIGAGTVAQLYSFRAATIGSLCIAIFGLNVMLLFMLVKPRR
ncbi:MFS transporter [Alteromonas sp. 345S023]|uniref:MFS transporter n=1 Tax=Alteromonas profundi TaxID=2696062 RepID=A0A7X5RMJ6_9ALTE|nr:sugar efflux transporter [Alteromonas profundi]NDV93062.1 MFS transporter [Alteromonas profundi]